MNIYDYEKIAADPGLLDKVAAATFYGLGRAHDSRFTALWTSVPDVEKAIHGQAGLRAILALVDDYTTPGCSCDYCTWAGETNHGRLIMCQKRWDALPREARIEIAESCAD